MSEVIMILGYPASGKSTVAKTYIDQGYIYLNRDDRGGKIIDLLIPFEEALQKGESVVLDNLFPTMEIRQPFIALARKYNVVMQCIYMSTSLEDAQVNALNRMVDRYGKVFLNKEQLKEVKSDTNMFPPTVLFRYRKEFEKPTTEEGFSSVEKYKFVRNLYPLEFSKKALILDYDGTLRKVKGSNLHFPTHPDHVEILPNRKEVLRRYKNQGYLLLGVSNQSGIEKGDLSEEMAQQCFDRTNELLEIDIEYTYCSHRVPPVSCYCRKPQSGLGVHLIHKYKLDPAKCIFVGDMKVDETFAKRVGFNYQFADDFFSAASVTN